MRYFLLALMIALLPVRGWVGNAMALEMASHQVMAQQSAPASEKNTESMPADCTMQAQTAGMTSMTDGDASTTATSALCNGCNTCELCLAIASFTWTDVPVGAFIPSTEPLANGTRFSSADSVSGLKPPIS